MFLKYLLLTFLLFTWCISVDRVVTLSPSLSEIVFALDKGKTLVGVSKYSSYPPEVEKIPHIGGYFSPSIETILLLRPTLVIGQVYHAKILGLLQKAGMTTLQVPLRSLQDIQDSISTIAKAIDANDSLVLHDIHQAIQEAKSSKRSAKKVLIMYGSPKSVKHDVMYVAGTNVFYNDIIELCGATNATKTAFSSEPKIYFETLLSLDPDKVLILHSKLTDGEIDIPLALSQWKNLPLKVSTNSGVKILDDAGLLIPSHRVATTIKKICRAIQE